MNLLEFDIDENYEFTSTENGFCTLGKIISTKEEEKTLILRDNGCKVDVVDIKNKELIIDDTTEIKNINAVNSKIIVNSIITFPASTSAYLLNENVNRNLHIEGGSLYIGENASIIVKLIEDYHEFTITFKNVKFIIDNKRDPTKTIVDVEDTAEILFEDVTVSDEGDSSSSGLQCYVLVMTGAFDTVKVDGGNVKYSTDYTYTALGCTDSHSKEVYPELFCELDSSLTQYTHPYACPCTNGTSCRYNFAKLTEHDFNIEDDSPILVFKSGDVEAINGESTTFGELYVKEKVIFNAPNCYVDRVIFTTNESVLEVDTELSISNVTISSEQKNGPQILIDNNGNLNISNGVCECNEFVIKDKCFVEFYDGDIKGKTFDLYGDSYVLLDGESAECKDATFNVRISGKAQPAFIYFNDSVTSINDYKNIKVNVYLSSGVDSFMAFRLPDEMKYSAKDFKEIITIKENVDDSNEESSVESTNGAKKSSGDWKFVKNCHGIVCVKGDADFSCPKDRLTGEIYEEKFPYYVIAFVAIFVILIVVVIVVIVVYSVHVIKERKRNADVFTKGEEVVDEDDADEMNKKEENEEVEKNEGTVNSVPIKAPIKDNETEEEEVTSKTTSNLSDTGSNSSSSKSSSSGSSN